MVRKLSIFAFGVSAAWGAATHKLELQTGRLKGDIAPSADYAVGVYRSEGFRAGAFTQPGARGAVASYAGEIGLMKIEIGQKERSLDNGFLISNGAYLPWTHNFAFAEPAGTVIGYSQGRFSSECAFYQQGQNNLLLARLGVKPVDWLRFMGGAATADMHEENTVQPIGSLFLGRLDNRTGFTAAVEIAGEGNYLGSLRYTDGYMLRILAFRRAAINPLASGIYENTQGVAAQYITDHWFAQFFAAGGEFGMVRYAGDYLTAVTVYEERNQLAGFSLRNSATGFHVRSGVTFATDASVQTLGGIGYEDYIFLGGGHYQTASDQPLEPLIFPSAWYSSLLLQSSSMRIRDRGFKLLALVNTGAVQGFFAVTYAEDRRERERFGFFMRLQGSVEF